MKTQLQQEIAKIAPYISINTYWSHDEDCGPISKDCCGFEESEDDEWQAWQSNVKAYAVINGEDVEGNAYLGGTWEKADILPEESNPDISGYEPQMTVEALKELAGKIEDEEILQTQIAAAIAHCKAFMALSYEAQRQQMQAA